MSKLMDAYDRVRDAEKALTAAIREEYPEGTVIEVSVGRGRFTAKVLSHEDIYANGYILVRNIYTKKDHRIFAPGSWHNIIKVDMPKVTS